MRVNVSSPQHLSPRLFSSMNVAFFCATTLSLSLVLLAGRNQLVQVQNKHSNLHSEVYCFCDLVMFAQHQIELKHKKTRSQDSHEQL